MPSQKRLELIKTPDESEREENMLNEQHLIDESAKYLIYESEIDDEQYLIIKLSKDK